MKRFFAAGLSLALSLSLCLSPASALTAEQAGQLLEDHYVDDVPQSVLDQDSVQEMLAALNDPYTVYMTQEEYQDFLGSVNGEKVVGIGVSMQNAVVDNSFLILSILPDSPAQEAGLQEGDQILAIDGTPVTSLDQISAISGPEGSQVTLTIRSAATGETRDVTLTRRAVQIPIVTYSLVDGAAVIDCVSFGDSTAATISKALTEYEDLNRPFILDLRSNPGGVTNAAAASASYFVGGGTMVFFRDGDGNYNYVYTDNSFPDLTDQPLIIMTNGYSASASELFSAAIRDHEGGIAVGQRTYGKGVAQVIFDQDSYPDLFDGDALKITVYRFYSPNGVTNDTVGVLPTLLVSEENTQAIALLLSSPQPEYAAGFWKLDLAGYTFYIDQEQAMAKENQAAFTELLEALPPSATLSQGAGFITWTPVSPAQAAKNLGLDYHSRYDFSDLKESAYPDEVATLAVYGLVSGTDTGAFQPSRAITRGEFAAMLYQALGLKETEGTSFSDVSPTDWYAQAVSALTAKGCLAGRGDGAFHPNDTITYEEMVTVLSAVTGWTSMEGYDLSSRDVPIGEWLSYAEWSVWAQSPAWRLQEQGVQLDLSQPRANATRDQAAHLMYQLLTATGLLWTV